MKIAQRFIAGATSPEKSEVPEGRLKPPANRPTFVAWISSRPSGTQPHSQRGVPSDKSLGYFRMPLRGT